jgi:hypothetical protein
MRPNALHWRDHRVNLSSLHAVVHHHHCSSQGDVRRERSEVAGVAKHDVIITIDQDMEPRVTVVNRLDRLPGNGVGDGRTRPSKG